MSEAPKRILHLINLNQLDKDILRVAKDYDRINIRQIFYRLVSSKKYANLKSRAFYEKVQRRILKLRKDHPALDAKITDRARYFQLGDRQDVIILTEKESIFNVIEGLAQKYKVSMMAMRGFPSATSLKLLPSGALVLLLTDFDPSGLAIRNTVPGKVEILAVNQSQIRKYHLTGFPIPARDTRAQKYRERFGGLGYELEAFKPSTLRKIVEDRLQKLPSSRGQRVGAKHPNYRHMTKKQLIAILEKS